MSLRYGEITGAAAVVRIIIELFQQPATDIPSRQSRAYDENHHEEKRFNIFISIPFDWGDDVTTPRRQIYMSNSTTFDDQGFASNNTDYQEQ